MKNDKYTKSVLTIIAICLIVIVLRDIGFIRQAFALNGVTKVTLCNPSGKSCGDDWVQYVRLN